MSGYKKIMTGELLKELEEDIHQEEWWFFWRTYGPFIIGLVLLTLLSTGGYLWWHSKNQRQREEESTRYEEALQSLETKGPNAEAETILEQLSIKGSPGYATLAQLHLFRLNAIRALTDPVARNQAFERGKKLVRQAQKDRDQGLEGAMLLNLVALSLNTKEALPEEFIQRLSQYDVPQNPWKGLSLESLGIKALQEKNRNEAQKIYMHLLTTSEVSQGVQMRASMEMVGEGFAFPERMPS